MLKIFNPIWVNETSSYFSISKWNFKELADNNGNLEVYIYQGGKLMGQGIVNKKQWIKTKKLRESKVVYRPDDPMVYYYNIMKFKSKAEKDLSDLKWATT
jgi:hypothetical protein